MQPMTPHEKECAFAAVAVRLERALMNRDLGEARQWRALRTEIEAAETIRDTIAKAEGKS